MKLIQTFKLDSHRGQDEDVWQAAKGFATNKVGSFLINLNIEYLIFVFKRALPSRMAVHLGKEWIRLFCWGNLLQSPTIDKTFLPQI